MAQRIASAIRRCVSRLVRGFQVWRKPRSFRTTAHILHPTGRVDDNGSESFELITVFVLPFDALGDATKFLDGSRAMDPDGVVQDVDLKFLTGLERELLPNLLGNDDLEFRGDFDGVHQ